MWPPCSPLYRLPGMTPGTLTGPVTSTLPALVQSGSGAHHQVTANFLRTQTVHYGPGREVRVILKLERKIEILYFVKLFYVDGLPNILVSDKIFRCFYLVSVRICLGLNKNSCDIKILSQNIILLNPIINSCLNFKHKQVVFIS